MSSPWPAPPADPLAAYQLRRVKNADTLLGSTEEWADELRGTRPPMASVNSLATTPPSSGTRAVAGLIMIGLATIFGAINLLAPGDFAARNPTFLLMQVGLVVALAGAAKHTWNERWRAIDTPTLELVAAYPGHHEFVGRLVAPVPAYSWLSHCLTVGYSAVRKNDDRVVWRREGWADEVRLEDATGAVEIDPEMMSDLIEDHGRRLASASLGQGSESGFLQGDEVYVHVPVGQLPDGRLVITRNRDLLPPGISNDVSVSFAREHRQRSSLLVLAVLETVGALLLLSLTLIALLDSFVLGALAGVTIGVVGFIVGYLWRWYNRFVAVRQQTVAADSYVGVVAAERSSTVDQLVQTVEASMTHERRLLAELRGHLNAHDMAAASGVIEQMPESAVGEQVEQLMRQLVYYENKLAAVRRYYNDAVTIVHDRWDVFPASLVAHRVFGNTRPALLDDLGDLDDATAPRQEHG